MMCTGMILLNLRLKFRRYMYKVILITTFQAVKLKCTIILYIHLKVYHGKNKYVNLLGFLINLS